MRCYGRYMVSWRARDERSSGAAHADGVAARVRFIYFVRHQTLAGLLLEPVRYMCVLVRMYNVF